MKKYRQVKIESFSGAKKYLWAVKMFFIAIFMSLLFGFVSEMIISVAGMIVAVLIICIFIFISVLFDMIGIAVVSADEEAFHKWAKDGVNGAERGLKLCNHSEKVCSFCADVVGDICSTLCGAGGATIVSIIAKSIECNQRIILISISTSALIAGLTIFFKAIMKEKAMRQSNKILLKLGRFLNFFIKSKKNKKNR